LNTAVAESKYSQRRK